MILFRRKRAAEDPPKGNGRRRKKGSRHALKNAPKAKLVLIIAHFAAKENDFVKG